MTLWGNRRDRESSYSDYVEARYAYLWRIAYALTWERDRADDLLQISLEKLYVAWPRIGHLDQPDAYTRKIMVRANIDESRRPWRREHPTELIRDDTPATQPFDVIDSRSDLAQAFFTLTPTQRRCVIYRHWLDLSVAQTAFELGIPEGTVKAHTSRGIARLRQELDPTTGARAATADQASATQTTYT